jgi:hypothetical protein
MESSSAALDNPDGVAAGKEDEDDAAKDKPLLPSCEKGCRAGEGSADDDGDDDGDA